MESFFRAEKRDYETHENNKTNGKRDKSLGDEAAVIRYP
jgi:hypothetical protein